MAISVIGARLEPPPRISSPGGTVTHVVTAKTQGGNSQMKIVYALADKDPYVFANGTRLESRPAAPIGPMPDDFRKVLQLIHESGKPVPPSINIFARAVEVVGGVDVDQQKVPTVMVTIVGIGAPAAAAAPRPAAAAAPRPAAAAAPRRAAAAPARKPAGLGKRLRARRKERGMTQREVAKKVGVSSSTISRVERGHEPSDRVRRAIEGFLGG